MALVAFIAVSVLLFCLFHKVRFKTLFHVFLKILYLGILKTALVAFSWDSVLRFVGSAK